MQINLIPTRLIQSFDDLDNFKKEATVEILKFAKCNACDLESIASVIQDKYINIKSALEEGYVVESELIISPETKGVQEVHLEIQETKPADVSVSEETRLIEMLRSAGVTDNEVLDLIAMSDTLGKDKVSVLLAAIASGRFSPEKMMLLKSALRRKAEVEKPLAKNPELDRLLGQVNELLTKVGEPIITEDIILRQGPALAGDISKDDKVVEDKVTPLPEPEEGAPSKAEVPTTTIEEVKAEESINPPPQEITEEQNIFQGKDPSSLSQDEWNDIGYIFGNFVSDSFLEKYKSKIDWDVVQHRKNKAEETRRQMV
jgi:hypothetical protein